MEPGYFSVYRSGDLKRRVSKTAELLSKCTLCPRNCRVDRYAGELGACGISADAIVSSYGPHYGEESVLVGRYGSGTVFFTGCNLACTFCQNYDTSQLRHGRKVSAEQLAEAMLDLQNERCHNINLVSPTHQVPQILAALEFACEGGLRLPIVYNCGGYESVETLRLLDGIIDIYMPDVKYGANESGMRYSGVPDYWDRARDALREMYRQVGDLVVRKIACDDGGTAEVAVRGLLVRHLVTPGRVAHTREVMRYIAEEISSDTYLNVMGQYRPVYGASEFAEINRQITIHEYREAVEIALQVGLRRLAD